MIYERNAHYHITPDSALNSKMIYCYLSRYLPDFAVILLDFKGFSPTSFRSAHGEKRTILYTLGIYIIYIVFSIYSIYRGDSIWLW